MVGYSSNGTARDRVLKLMQEKDAIEREIREQSAILEAENQVGMHGPLVDEQGFPRSDIDIYKVRHARHRIICLQNDHKTIMKRIEQGLADVHSQFLLDSQSSSSTSQNGHYNGLNGHANGQNGHANGQNGHYSGLNGHTNGLNGHANGLNGHASGDDIEMINDDERNRSLQRPFAKITHIQDGSPAQIDGLRSEDEILQFGSINSGNFHEITQVNEIVRHSINQPIRVAVRRNGHNVESLSLTPRRWAQPGLLGCQIVGITI